MDFQKAFSRPFSDMKKWVIGCALNLITIANFFALGYIGESAKLTLQKKGGLPEWTNWGQLFIQGLLMAVISVVWAIPAMIIILILGVSLFPFKELLTVTRLPQTEQLSALANLFVGSIPELVIFVIIAFIISAFTYYLSSAAILNYLSKNKFGEGFNFKVAFNKAFTQEYFVAALVLTLLGLVITPFTFFLGFIPFLGTLVQAVLGFTVGIIGFTLLAQAYKK